MRKQFVTTIEQLSKSNSKLITLLGDIGVYSFRNVFHKYNNRIYNLGICEQSLAGIAAGLAKEGFIPVIHSIAPFIVERCYEQIKCDICYQGMGVNIVSVGASYDYAASGCTHHCPGDISILSSLPGMEIVVPGNAHEFDQLFRQSYANNNPTYYRLSEVSNNENREVIFGKANVIKTGTLGTVIVFGTAFDYLPDSIFQWDISLIYYTTVCPFDHVALIENTKNKKIIIIEPYYTGSINKLVSSSLKDKAITIHNIGIPTIFLSSYGTRTEHDETLGLTKNQLVNQLKTIIYEE